MPAEVVAADLSRGALVKIVPEDAPPKGYAVPMRAIYLSDAPPGIAGRWFIDRLQRGPQGSDGASVTRPKPAARARA